MAGVAGSILAVYAQMGVWFGTRLGGAPGLKP